MIYHVIANDGRATGIEADSFALLGDEYQFKQKDANDTSETTVASLNKHAVFAVIEDDAFLGSFYPDDEDQDEGPEDDQDEDDMCLDCRILGLLDSEEFYEAVVGVIESHCNGSGEDTPPEAEPLTPQTPEVPKVNHYRDKDGDEFWGFSLPDDPTQIVDFEEENHATTGALAYSQGYQFFTTFPASEATLVEDVQ